MTSSIRPALLVLFIGSGAAALDPASIPDEVDPFANW